MLYRLVILSGALKGQRISVAEDPIVIGRAPDCTLPIRDEELALRHAVIERKPDGLVIRDLGSMSGILLNNREVREAHLRHGDVVELGLTRLLVQAALQADVEEETPPRRGAKSVGLMTAAIILINAAVLIAGYSFWRAARPVPEDRGAAPPATDTVTPVTVAAPAVTAAAAPAVSRSKPSPVAEDEVGFLVKTAKTETAATTLATAAVPPAASGVVAAAAPPAPAPREIRPVMIAVSSGPPAEPRAPALRPQPPAPQPRPVVAKPVPVARPVPAPPVAPAAAVRILAADQKKFPESADADEMRVLNIQLGVAGEGRPSVSGPVRVDVEFYDQDTRSGAVSRSRAITVREPLSVEGAWAPGERKLLTTTYVVPKGFRAREARENRPSQYYGFVVRVRVNGVQQDLLARPVDLLNR